MASARVETVRGLAAARFDWEQALRDLSRAVPGDVKLETLNGDMGLPGTGGGSGDPLRGSIQAPAISLAGCAPSQTSVARMLARLRAVDGVTRVSLSKSEKSDGETDSACAGSNPPVFSAVVFFERSAALSQFAPATSDASAGTGTTVPVPSAVESKAPSAGGGSASAGNSAQAGAEGAASTPTSTSGAVSP
jgi:hypothetical protein